MRYGRPIPKYEYSAVVYKDGNKVIARDKYGKIIAKGKSGEDDADVIQSAINNTGKVIIKKGSYILNKKLILHAGRTIEGENKLRTKLIFNGDDDEVIYIDGVSEYTHSVRVAHLSIEANGKTGIFLEAEAPNVVTKTIIEDLLINYPNYGLRLRCKKIGSEIYKSIFRDIWIYRPYESGILADSTDIGIPASGVYLKFENIEIQNPYKYGIINWTYNSTFEDIMTDGIINEMGYKNTWINLTIETIWTENPPQQNALLIGKDGPDYYTGYDCTFINLKLERIDPNKCQYGIVIKNKNTTIIDPQIYGDVIPNIDIIPYYTVTIISPNKLLTVPDSYKDNILVISRYFKNSGTATFSGDGSTTQFKIEHGLKYEPTKVLVTPLSADASGQFYVTKDDTYIYINYITPPPAGTNNIILSWYAEV